jgi:hypothetical protein
MPGHRIAHHAEPEKRHFRHSVLPSRACGALRLIARYRSCDGKRAGVNRQSATLTMPAIALC